MRILSRQLHQKPAALDPQFYKKDPVRLSRTRFKSYKRIACHKYFFCLAVWGPWEASKGQISLVSITKSISKIFIPNFVCVLTNERYKTYQTGFSFCYLGHVPGVGLWAAGGAQVVKKKFFSIMVMWHIKSTRMKSRTECK